MAATDTYGLYNAGMATAGNFSGQSTGAGILRSGGNGSYNYSVIGSSGNLPVTFVSWFDAARFTNWLCNGQQVGAQDNTTTETGAYTLNGAMSGLNFTKNGNATFWIPSEDEWYKAAYYDPNKGGLGVGGYWLYPTKSNTAPGNVVGSSPNQANFRYSSGGTQLSDYIFSVTQSAALVSTQNYLTDVGAFSGSASPYGTYDQGAVVRVWSDTVVSGAIRERGTTWQDLGDHYMQASVSVGDGPTNEESHIGFRIATVPEPTSAALLGLGTLLLAARRRRRV